MRLATHSQNQANSRLRKDNNSGRKGVKFRSDIGKWQAQIKHLGKFHYLGCFPTLEEADNAYKAKAVELFGEFARI